MGGHQKKDNYLVSVNCFHEKKWKKLLGRKKNNCCSFECNQYATKVQIKHWFSADQGYQHQSCKITENQLREMRQLSD